MSTASTPAVKIVFVAGAGRSGSTLLDNMLGQIPGAVSTGQLIDIWGALQSGGMCGCGRLLAQCETWRAVTAEAARLGLPGDIAAILRRHSRAFRMNNLPALVMGKRPSADDRQIKLELGALYAGIQAVTQCRVIVDSSKSPAYGMHIAQLPGVDLYVLHLIRDPRAVAYSWLRRRLHPSRLAAHPLTAVPLSAARWALLNIGTEAAWNRSPRTMRLHYEDVTRHPATALRRVIAWLGEPPSDLIRPDHSIDMATCHTVGGNPGRFQTGRIVIQEDDEWRRLLSQSARWTVNALTWPLLLRYRYTLRA